MKKSIFKRVLSFVLAIAMVLTMSSFSELGQIVAMAEDTTYRLYFELPEDTTCADWCVNAWDGVTVSGNSEVKFRPSTWGDGDTYPTLLQDESLTGWGYVEITGNISGLQFVNLAGYEYKCWNSAIASTGKTTAYFVPGADGQGIWYSDSAKTTEIKLPEVEKVFYVQGTLPGLDWDEKNDNGQMIQSDDDENIFSITFKNVPAGTYQYKILQDPKNYGWDKCFGSSSNRVLEVEVNTDVTLSIDIRDEDKNVTVETSTPAEFKVAENKNGTTKFIAIGERGQNVVLYYAYVKDNQVGDFTSVDFGKIEKASVSKDIYLGDDAAKIVYYYMIDEQRVVDEANSETINEVKYFSYDKPEFSGRETVNVPGTFPGASWDATSNKMTYMGNGLYEYTFKNVPAANYQYKIAFGSWDENYGAGGKFDGSNYNVTVPAKQDVTIYYQDIYSHNSVTSLNYKFVEASVKGTDVAETALTDIGLTGIYSGKVNLEADTYSDVVLSITENGEKTEKPFGEFTVAEAKDVTFYYAPEYDVYYNDAVAWTEATQVTYDTKNSNNKSIYGAVPTNTDVTFTVNGDANVTAVKLFVKQNSTTVYPLTRVGETKDWSVTTKFENIGEYTYFFVVYSGSAVKVYCDDSKKDYGEGQLTDLTSVVPYDLVVYDKNFKTPDWMKNAVIYQIFPDRFNNGDASNDDAQVSARGETDYELVDWSLYPENPEQELKLSDEAYAATNAFAGDKAWNNEIYGGDFKGIVERIDYLKALGVNVIYLNPVFSSISSHRYDATDYGVMDPILGGDGDFAELVRVAKENNMKIVLDGVFNHVSDDSIYFDRYYKFLTASNFNGKIGAYPYWAYVYDYMAENSATQEAAETAARSYFETNYGVTDFSYATWFEVYNTTLKDDEKNDVKDNIGLRAGKPVYGYEGWWGYDSMPVIKSTNGSEYQTDDWAKEIIGNSEANNGSIAQYWLKKGSNGWRLDVANEVSDETWQNFRDSVKAMDSDNVIIGEIWDDATEYLLGDMYDSVMNYVFRGAVLSYAKGGDASASMATLEKLRERYPEEAFYAMMNLVDSHDTTRVLSYLDGINDDRSQKEVDKAFPTYEKTSDAAKQKQYLVALLQFTYAGAPTVYYGDEIGMVGADDPDDRRAFEWGQGNEQLVKYYAKLANIRSKYAALRTGDITPITTGNENVLGYVRSDDTDTLAVLTNNSKNAIEYTLNLTSTGLTTGEYTELISGEKYTANETSLVVNIPANSGIILTTTPKALDVNEEALKPAYDPAYILKSDLSAAGLNVELEQDTFEYDGNAKTPAVSKVVYRGKTLVKDTDYTVAYSDNVNVGTAKVTITGCGAYKGQSVVNFTIKAQPTPNPQPTPDPQPQPTPDPQPQPTPDPQPQPQPTPDPQPQPELQSQTITGVKSTYTKTYTSKAFKLGAKAKTKLTYKSSNTKVVKVDANGKVTIKGVGTAKITIKAAASDTYKAASKTVTIKVKKGSQTIKTKVTKKTYKESSLKKKAATFKIGATAKTSITYKVVSGKKYITVSKKGVVKVSKNAKKGTYKILVTAKETSKYNKKTKYITITIK